ASQGHVVATTSTTLGMGRAGIYSSIHRPPLTSTLFPYTTLFRSLPDIPVHSIAVDPTLKGRIYLGTDLGVFVSVNSGATWMVERDRKSTRLNSSHVEISYAVFCLKKKTNPS